MRVLPLIFALTYILWHTLRDLSWLLVDMWVDILHFRCSTMTHTTPVTRVQDTHNDHRASTCMYGACTCTHSPSWSYTCVIQSVKGLISKSANPQLYMANRKWLNTEVLVSYFTNSLWQNYSLIACSLCINFSLAMPNFDHQDLILTPRIWFWPSVLRALGFKS
jgi:hypothetical protein